MSLILVLDCGATNLRAIAVDLKGQIVASQYLKNETLTGSTGLDHHIWDFEQIWQKLCQCAKAVIARVGAQNIVALTVTTFGVMAHHMMRVNANLPHYFMEMPKNHRHYAES